MKRIIASLILTLALTTAYAHPGFGYGHPGNFGPGYPGNFGPGFGYTRPFPMPYPPMGYQPYITPYNYMNYIGYQQFGYYQWQPAYNYYYWIWYPNFQPMWWTPFYYTTPYWNGYYL